MADCNIRNIDPGFLKRMKVQAAKEGVTLRAWCVMAFDSMMLEAEYGSAKEQPISFPQTGATTPNTIRPVHADGCKCFVCKPPQHQKT